MGFTVFMNVIGSIFAIIGIVLYSRDLADPSVLSLCDHPWYSAGNDDDACRNVAFYAQVIILIKHKAGAIPYFSYCQQIPWNESLSVALSAKPIGSCTEDVNIY